MESQITGDLASENQASLVTGEVEVTKPTLTYKGAFLVGGMAFAAITYVIGTYVYELENQFVQKGTLALDLVAPLQHIPREHPVTLIPWILGTTLLSIALGYLFDKQVQYRRAAEKLQARAEMLAVVDGLTQVYNHAYFLEQLHLDIKRTKRQLQHFALLLIDLDDFKRYNDTCGHLQGDELLQLVARTIKSAARDTDLVARYGGDEFVVIAETADGDGARLLGERIRRSIEVSTPITLSIGISAYPQDGETVDELIEAADRSMYRAKREGKNVVFLAASH